MLIFDYVLYNGKPIIEFRLNFSNNYVDRIIIVESIYTFSGNKKDELYYNIYKHIFEKYKQKIFFYSIHNFPTKIECSKIRNNNLLYDNNKSWNKEVYQRDFIQKIYNDITYIKPFITFVCDVDENPHLWTCLGSMAAAQAVVIILYIPLYSAAAFRIRTRMKLHRTGGQP